MWFCEEQMRRCTGGPCTSLHHIRLSTTWACSCLKPAGRRKRSHTLKTSDSPIPKTSRIYERWKWPTRRVAIPESRGGFVCDYRPGKAAPVFPPKKRLEPANPRSTKSERRISTPYLAG